MKSVLIMGIGKSGMSAAEFFAGSAEVSVWDAKTEDQLNTENVSKLRGLGVSCYFGETPQKEFDEVIISPGINPNNEIAKKGKVLKGELELAYENCKGSFTAITGTNGKTTTTTIVGEILKAADIPSFVGGNIGTPICDFVKVSKDEDIMVTEVSSFQLETISTFRPHVACILNLSPDHLDRHGSEDAYYKAKCRIFENQTEEDILVYNMDDENTVNYTKTAKSHKVGFTRTKTEVEFSDMQDVAYVKDGKIVIRKDGKEKDVVDVDALLIPGTHNLENALAACAVAVFSGAKARTVGKVLKTFKGVEHRMETVRELGGVKYINDSKGTNPDSSIKALNAVKTPIILIAGGYEKNSDFHEFVKAFDGKVRYLILLGKTADRIRNTAVECGFDDDCIIKCSSLEACVYSAQRLAEKGDTVLLSPACASWDMFENFEERGELFKDVVKGL